jgi:adenylate kinase
MSGFAPSSSSGAGAKLPNVLITGTPGTGKTSTAQMAAERTGLKHINVGDVVKAHNCHEGKDEEGFDAFILDEDKLCDVMEPMLAEGGCLVDFHTSEIFPERWFELVLVLRSTTEVLFDRLTERGYNDKKRAENVEAEIMQVCVEAARESYAPEIVHELQSNAIEDLESNVDRIVQWLDAWKTNNNYTER